VTTTLDGRRLDTREAVLEFIAELEAQRSEREVTAEGSGITVE
jgi:hypothetical protein